MSDYIIKDGELYHKGAKGMKWGYNKGKKNGKRTAGEIFEDLMGQDEYEDMIDAKNHWLETAKDVPIQSVLHPIRTIKNGGVDPVAYEKYVNAGKEFEQAAKRFKRTPGAQLMYAMELGKDIVDSIKYTFSSAAKKIYDSTYGLRIKLKALRK